VPIYEYRCNKCRRRVSVLVRSYSPPEHPTCDRCGSDDLRRLVSRVAVLRSEESRLESLADPSSLAGLDENDPKSLARWMRKSRSRCRKWQAKVAKATSAAAWTSRGRTRRNSTRFRVPTS
jgi:putative FmdB family regulatory protein